MIGEFLSSRASARHALFLALTAIAAATLLISDSQAGAETTAVITLSITSASAYIAEGESATITATLDRPAPEFVFVGIGHDGTANNTDDYKTLLPYFSKGQQTATFRITAIQDTIAEPDETVELTAFLTFRESKISARTQTPIHIVIVDGGLPEDAKPYVTLTADDYNPDEGDTVTITATLNQAADEGGVEVTISADDQSTASSDDYTLPTTPITITENNTTGTATITITDDEDDDDNEILVLNATATGLTANGTTLIIVDNDESSLSNDATLSALALANAADSSNISFTPTFNAQTTSYTANVDSDVSQITITPTTNHAGATVAVGDDTVSSGSPSNAIDIEYGSATIFVTVTAEDGKTKKPYSIEVNRPNPPVVSPVPSYSPGTASPTSLTLTANPSNPTEGGTVTITATLNEDAPANGTTVTLKVDTSASSASSDDYTLTPNTITITENSRTGTAKITTIDDTRYESSETIFIRATSANPSLTSNTVRISIINNDSRPRSYYRPPSNDATLLALAMTRASDSSTIDFTPTFVPDTTSYTATVDTNVSQVKITPTINHVGAIVAINGNPVSSGSPSNPIDIDYGENTIRVVVTAADRSTIKTYSINVNRPKPAPPKPPAPQPVASDLTFSPATVPLPTTLVLTIDPQNPTEGGTVTITATLDEPAPANGTTVTLNVDTATSTADNDDYTRASNTINIAENATSGTTTITTIDDTQSETTETIAISATSTDPSLNSNNIQISITDNDPAATPTPTPAPAIYNPLILRVEPAFRNITLFAGDIVALEVHVYGRQNIRNDSLADGLNLEWDDDTTGTFQNAEGLTAQYHTPQRPGRYTVTAALPDPERNCYAFRDDEEQCVATFNITARRPPIPPTPETPPVNPDGDIPETITDAQGENYKVFTPVEGGTHAGEDATFTAPPSAVPDNQIIGINITKDGPASNTKTTQRRQYRLFGHWYRVKAIDSAGQPLDPYLLEKPAKICLPLPDELRSKITNISIAQDEQGNGNLTILTSNLIITADGPIVCAATSLLPINAAIAVTAEHAPQLPPAPVFQTPDETLPETGGLQPPHPAILILAIILTLAALITTFTVARSPSLPLLRTKRETQ